MPSLFKLSRFSNLYKPAIILISTYAVVNLIGFFLQHDFSKPGSSVKIKQVSIYAEENLVIEEKVVSPAPPEIKVRPKKKILPLRETINPHLP